MILSGEPTSHDWRDRRRYTALRGIDRAGMMWEWLRRDPGYVAWYTRASLATRGAAASAEDRADDPLPWGLHFRGAAGPPGTRSQDHLAGRA
jgi:hypothetical protein